MDARFFLCCDCYELIFGPRLLMNQMMNNPKLAKIFISTASTNSRLTANDAIGGATGGIGGEDASAVPAERHGQGRVRIALAARTYNSNDFQKLQFSLFLSSIRPVILKFL